MMTEAADKLEFERAASLRNRLQALSHITADQTINPEGFEEADVFAAHQDGGQTCVQVFFLRSGQNWGNRAYFPRADRSVPVEEVLSSFIAQFYDDKPVPRLILLSHELGDRELLAEALSLKAERKVEIRMPQRGAKTGLVEHALANAREALGRKLAEGSSQRRLLEGVAERFGLPRVPRRIEVFDNSHIAGTNAVGAMIVAGPEGFVKGQYRKFNIKSEGLTPGDDYAMMREVLERRFKRLLADKTGSGSTAAPDDADIEDSEIMAADAEAEAARRASRRRRRRRAISVAPIPSRSESAGRRPSPPIPPPTISCPPSRSRWKARRTPDAVARRVSLAPRSGPDRWRRRAARRGARGAGRARARRHLCHRRCQGTRS